MSCLIEVLLFTWRPWVILGSLTTEILVGPAHTRLNLGWQHWVREYQLVLRRDWRQKLVVWAVNYTEVTELRWNFPGLCHMCLFLWLILIYILSSKYTITSSIMAFSGFCESIQQIIKTEGGLSDAQTRNWCQSEDCLVDYSLTWHRIIKIIFSPGQRVGRFAKSSYKRQNCLIAVFFWNMPSPHVWVLPFPHHIDLWELGSGNYTIMLLWELPML